MHEAPIPPGPGVIIIDDLIATGCSSTSALDLVKLLKGNPVGFGAVIELAFLGGVAAIRKAHPEVDVFCLLRYS